MNKQEIIEKADKLNWFHKIELFEGYTTKGVVDHCTEESANNRYGIPTDLFGKSVLDIGCNNGYFSFLSERRGSIVTSIDPNQGDGDNIKCFELASEALKSNALFEQTNLELYCGKRKGGMIISIEELRKESGNVDYSLIPTAISNDKFWNKKQGKIFDICYLFGTLYHLPNPIEHLQCLFNCTSEYALIETAIAQNNYGNNPVWELNAGFDNDPSNAWYPSLGGLTAALKYVGFSQVELIYNDGIRCTVKAIV